MKTLNDFLLEMLKLNSKNLKKTNTTITIHNPSSINHKWSINLDVSNLGKYIVYLDKYRNDLPHLTTFFDMCMNILLDNDDYEDFDINGDVLYSSDNPEDVIDWYIINYVNKNKNYCDNNDILFAFKENPKLMNSMDDNYDIKYNKVSDLDQETIDDMIEKYSDYLM